MSEDKKNDLYEELINESNDIDEEINEDLLELEEYEDEEENLVSYKNLKIAILLVLSLILIFIGYNFYKNYSLNKNTINEFKINDSQENYAEANNILNSLIEKEQEPDALCYRGYYTLSKKNNKDQGLGFKDLSEGLKAGCQQGHIDSYNYVNEQPEEMINAINNYSLYAQSYFSEMYKKGFSDSMDLFLSYLEKSEVPNKESKMMNILREYPEQSQGDYYLGKLMINPNSNKYNILRGYEYFQTAADLGNSRAYFEMGKLHLFGYDPAPQNPNSPKIEKNYQLAKSYITRSVLEGNYDLAVEAGDIMFEGKYGTPVNFSQALEFYLIAEKNDTILKSERKEVYKRLAQIYYNGLGTRKDLEEYQKYLNKYQSL